MFLISFKINYTEILRITLHGRNKLYWWLCIWVIHISEICKTYFSVYFVYEGKTTQKPTVLLYHIMTKSFITLNRINIYYF